MKIHYLSVTFFFARQKPVQVIKHSFRAPLFFVLILAAHTNLYPADLARQYTSMALQGDLSGAHALFNDSPPNGRTPLENELAHRFNARFRESSDMPEVNSDIPFVKQVIEAYQAYWTRSLTGQLDQQPGYSWLDESLDKLIKTHYPDQSTNSELSSHELTASLLDQYPVFVSSQNTGQYRDLIVWQDQQEKNYTVELTDDYQPVTVIFMNDFLSYGWRDFATFGTAPTSGWADSDAIYCVAWSYDTGSENFKISFLKHEARHQADYKRFPDLPLTELEYRAKLTELAFAQKSVSKLLSSFRENSADNEDSPHSQANYRVIRDLALEMNLSTGIHGYDPWSTLQTDLVNKSARQLLHRNDELLMSAGR